MCKERLICYFASFSPREQVWPWHVDCSLFPKLVHEGSANMLYWALVFLVIAIIAGILGFVGIAGAAAEIAKVLFFIFIVLFIVSLIAGRRTTV
jgi:uncharacterized membrane protein YtjA (UPF0391 family)